LILFIFKFIIILIIKLKS